MAARGSGCSILRPNSCVGSFSPCMESDPRRPTPYSCMPEITLYLSSMRTHTEYSAAMESRTESPSMRESGRCSKQPCRGIRNSSTNSTRWLSIQGRTGAERKSRAARNVRLVPCCRQLRLFPKSTARHGTLHEPKDDSVSTGRKSQLLLGFGGLAIALLLSAVITLGSLTLPFEPRQWDLYALTVFIVAALLVFVVILTRSLLRLWSEQRAHQPGSRFKTKMVLGAIAVSFLPVVFLFFVSYALLNRTLVLWFPRPLEMATQASRDLINEIGRSDYDRMTKIAKDVAVAHAPEVARDTIHLFDLTFARGADIAWEATEQNHPIAVGVNSNFRFNPSPTVTTPFSIAQLPIYIRSMPSGAELWQFRGKYFLAGGTFRMISRAASRKLKRKR